MSLFQCDNCGVIENTALTFGYLARLIEPDELEKKGFKRDGKYCSECHDGKWHGKFPKEIFPVGTMETDRVGNVRRRGGLVMGESRRGFAKVVGTLIPGTVDYADALYFWNAALDEAAALVREWAEQLEADVAKIAVDINDESAEADAKRLAKKLLLARIEERRAAADAIAALKGRE